VGETYLSHLLESANLSFKYSVEEIIRKDSLDLTADDRELICSKVSMCSESRVVITHGTDTMALTGQALQMIHDKTIVLTGSMQPARFHESDAAFNVGFAIAAAQCLPPGVYMAINGRIFNPSQVEKNIDKNRFEPRLLKAAN